jgi:acid phosphatase (class A)
MRVNGTGAVLALALLAGCATAPPPPPTSIAAVGELRPGLGIAKGYLAAESLPDSLALVPAPPGAGTAAMAADEEAFRVAAAATAERFAQAAADADLRWPQAVAGYEAVLGTSVSGDATPHTAMLLRRVMADGGLSTYRAKNHYKRVRPFVVNNVPSCTPQDEAALRGDGSYPSGHAAIGWMLALVLTDLAPQRTDALLKRGFEFGESRMVCRVHWRSDVAAGRLMASAAYARLQSDPVFRAQRDLARAELAKVSAR